MTEYSIVHYSTVHRDDRVHYSTVEVMMQMTDYSRVQYTTLQRDDRVQLGILVSVPTILREEWLDSS